MSRRSSSATSKKSRSSNNTGTIRQRSDGRWEARVTVGIDSSSGKLIRKSIYGVTQSEVRKEMTKVQTSLDNGTYIAPHKITVGEWMDEWFETFCSNSLKPYTLSGYDVIIRNHIKPNIGSMQLQTVKGIHIQRMYNTISASGAAPKTVKNIGAMAHKAFDVAVKQGLILNNPCNAAELPKVYKHEIKPLEDADITIFLKAIEGHMFENAFALCLFAGLREGECLGLSWEQVDFDKQTIVVSQQLQRHKEKGGQCFIAKSTKSSKPRKIMPPPIAFEYLRKEQTRQRLNQIASGQDWCNADNLVFTTKNGRYIYISTFYKNFKAVAEQIGRPDLRPHDLRHTAATVAIASGADVKSVQNLLGHATASFTLNVYTHASQKMMEDTAAKVQRYYSSIQQ